MEIYLIRHTKPAIESGVCYGRSDIDLAESFPEEMELLHKKIPKSFDAVYTSPLKRCYRLAKKLNTDSLKICHQLMELDFGDWEMRKWNEIDKAALDAWMNDFVNNAPPNGESYLDLSRRAITFFEEIISGDNTKVAIVSHGGVIRALVSYISAIPLSSSFTAQFNFGKVTHISVKENYKTVKYVNL
jgi:alpha-ribazole phosphatase